MKLDSTSKTDRLGWRMPIYPALAAVLVFLPLVISSNTNVLYLFVIVPGFFLIGICALTYVAIRKKPPIALIVATFWAVSVLLFVYNFPIRTFTRWFSWSGRYKNKVLAQPASIHGELKPSNGMVGDGLVKTSRFFLFSIPPIRFPGRPKAVNE